MSLIQAMKDDARELQREHEAEQKKAAAATAAAVQARRNKASAEPDKAQSPRRPSLDSDAGPSTTVRRGSISKPPGSVTTPVSPGLPGGSSRLNPHASFRKSSAVDSDDDFNFGGMTIATEKTKELQEDKERFKPPPMHPKVKYKKPPRISAATMARQKAGLPGDLGPNDPRRGSAAAPAVSKSQSPTGRTRSPVKKPKKRRASDGALLPKTGRPEQVGVGAGGTRLPTDPDEEAAGSSDDEYEGDSDDESGIDERGRERERRSGRVGQHIESGDESEEGDANRGRTLATPSTPLSPNITVTPPHADNTDGVVSAKRTNVQPHSAFDNEGSAASTPRHSDDEELSELRRAQRLSLTISPIHSTPSAHRVIRQIVRGDYAHFQREAEEGRRRQRMYLVATDLSPEAEYALEWTIGTVLRDGDTLLALYAVDEEGGVAIQDGVEIGHGADVVKDTANIVGSLPVEKVSQSPAPSPLSKNSKEGSRARLPNEHDGMTKAERERFKAAQDITERCVRLLRKTRLQIRVVVEVFHCKSPKHMITEVIDFLSPTLTILGSRGRSALKGVLLGSFSNYLVTKSSVPVMVARRKLRKHNAQKLHRDGLPIAGTGDGRMVYGRMSNVLAAPVGSGKRGNRLAGAKVD